MTQFDHSYFMNKAFGLASKAADKNEVPVGALIVVDNKIIGQAHNQTEVLTDCTAHAEMLAITAAQSYLNSDKLVKCTLYVTLEPCPMCAAALYWCQLGSLVYAACDSKRGFTLFQPSLLHPKTLVSKGIMKDECGALMSNFFKSKR
jgi:tRNA(adenine34) deaminase